VRCVLSLPTWSEGYRGFLNVTQEWLEACRQDVGADLIIIQCNGRGFIWPQSEDT
jgi:hypothetical protein